MAIWYIAWPFGIFNDHLINMYIFCTFGVLSPFWFTVPRKIWQPCLGVEKKKILFSFHCIQHLSVSFFLSDPLADLSEEGPA
jgi:hypothetical protein